MNLSISRPIQILALVGLLAAVAGGGLMLLKSKPKPTAAPPSVTQIRARAHARNRALHKTHPVTTAKHATKPHTAAVAAKPAPAKTKTAAKPVVAKATTPKPAPTPKPTIAANGLPIPLANALQSHSIVVVSLFDPQSQTDAISYAEARAGAADAGVGFLGVSVLDDAVAAPLTSVLPGGGLLPDPGVLVFSAPATLVLRLDGFADRTAVAQAAAQALSGRATSTP